MKNMLSKFVSLLTVLIMLTAGLAACGPTPEPQVVEVEKEVEVTKVVEVEKEVEVTRVVEVEKEVILTPTPVPDITPTPVPDILIGVIQPLSGANAPGGLEMLYGFEVAVDLVNNVYPDIDLPFAATSGIPCMGGAKLRLVVADHQADPQKGASEAERLITEKGINILSDMNFSSVTAAAQPIAERYGIPFICSGGTSVDLMGKGLKWWFRVGAHDGIYTEAMFKMLDDYTAESGAEIHTLGLIYEDTLFGQTSAATQTELASQYGYEVIVDVPYRRETTTLSSEILLLKAANPDVVMMTSFLADAILLVTTMKDLDFTAPMVIAQGGSPAQPGFVNAVGDVAEGLMTRSSYAPELLQTDETVRKLAELYQDRAGISMGTDAPSGMQTLFTIADILSRACSTDPEAILKATEETDIPADRTIMPGEGVRFDPTTHQNIGVSAVIRQLHDNQYVTVWPFEIAAMEIIYPIPPWAD